MKKLFFLVSFLVFIGLSSAWAQPTVNKQELKNAKRTYKVNEVSGVHATDHDGNTYTWAVYQWNGQTDYSDGGWTATAATSPTDFSFSGAASGVNMYSKEISWNKGGYYVIQVTESAAGNNCTTIRRFGIQVLELDLLVKTFDLNTTTPITDPVTRCNTDEGKVWTSDDNDDLNSATGVIPALGTMVYTYKISLYTVDGSTNSSDLIGNVLSNAKWRFTPSITATSTPTGGTLTWNITGATSGTMGSPVIVPAGTSEITITATIKNIAADEAAKYVLNIAIDPSSVNVDNGGVADDYLEGTEGAGTTHSNNAVQITVNPIPNTSKISFN